MKHEPVVDIVMATYNGARYVDEQIRSFCRQTYSDWRLIVHDDGSTDGTQDILRQWTKKEKRVIFIEDGITKLGVARHFIHILQYADALWIMWADQDDIWFENKVETMLRAAEKANFKGAGVVYANAELWNEEQGVISHKNTLFYPTSLRDTLFLNSGIQGASAMFNSAMRDLLRKPLTAYAMHDHVLLLAALTMGEIVYLPEPLMYYRQHEANVTGHAPGSKRKKLQLMWTNRHVPVVSREHLEGLRAFYQAFQTQINEEDKQVIETFLQLPECTFGKRFRMIRKAHYTLMGSRCLLWIKLIIRRYI
ncbi:MAG: glycosyltransferase family 2 protein [Paludibacteraceae bacterium]|nr:glycosyltransferase family 2 protein [Paludibacteraceae bacterium]